MSHMIDMELNSLMPRSNHLFQDNYLRKRQYNFEILLQVDETVQRPVP